MFNTNSRLKNIILSSTFGVLEQCVSYLMLFIFQTVFLGILSKNYLGISGLFTNILQIFSLAELGIGSVISYRMYEPIKEQDIDKCGALMQFYRRMYHNLFWIILVIGMAFYPFINSIIKDANEIPNDVNIKFIYVLFVIQSATSYLFVYMQSLLSADQKGYVISFFNMFFCVISNIVKILVLFVSKDYTLTLIVGITVNLLYNAGLGILIKNSYKEIIKSKAMLSKKEKKNIYKDTGALLCHKIGYTVVKSTDSIILSKFIGVAIIGIYSNYMLITNAIDICLNKLFGSFVSTIGNISISKSKEERFEIYKKMLFLDLWVSSFFSISLFININIFIEVWLDKSYILPLEVVLLLTINLFSGSSRIINTSFINGNGLFVKDRLRPLAEALINLVISIFLVDFIGIAGVVVGTLMSTLLTVWWREPVILYKYVFEKKCWNYFKYYAKWTVISIIICTGLFYLCKDIPISIGGILLRVLICTLVINGVYIIVFHKSEQFIYYKNFLFNKIKSR